MFVMSWTDANGKTVSCNECVNSTYGKLNKECIACRHAYGMHTDEEAKAIDWLSRDYFKRKVEQDETD